MRILESTRDQKNKLKNEVVNINFRKEIFTSEKNKELWR